MHLQRIPPQIPTGDIRTFGPLGPHYQIGTPVRALEDGDWLVDVTLIETGEHAEYRLTHLLEGPAAR